METNNKVVAVFARDNITLKITRSNQYYSFALSDDQESIYYDMSIDESNTIRSMANLPIEQYVGFMKHRRYDGHNNVNYSEKIEFKPVVNLKDKQDSSLDIKIRWKYGNHSTTYKIRLNASQFNQYQQLVNNEIQ